MQSKINYIFFLLILLMNVKTVHSQKLFFKPDFIADSIQLKKSYLTSDSLIRISFDELKKIDTAKTDMIIVYGFYIDNIEKNIFKINKYELSLKIDLLKNDPLSIREKLNLLLIETERTRTTIQQTKLKLDQLYFEKGMYFKKRGTFLEAEHCFINALKINSKFVYCYYYLSELYLLTNKPYKAATTLFNAFENNIKDTFNSVSFQKLANKINAAFVVQADSLTVVERYNESISLLESSLKFSSITWFKNNDELIKSLRSAKLGLYYSYLKIARKALDVNKFTIVESLVNEATQFQLINTTFISNNHPAENMIIELAYRFILKGQQFNNAKQYQKALESFNQAKRLYTQYNIPYINKLIEGINTAHTGIYNQLIPVLQKDTTEKNRKVASNPDVIKKITYEKFTPNKIAPPVAAGISKESDLLKRQLIDTIRTAYIKAWANDLKNAKRIFDESCNKQIKFHLTQDSSVNASLSNLKNKIRQRECENYSDKYETLLEKGNRKIRERSYSEAINYFAEGILAANENHSCLTDTSKASALRKKYSRPAQYQQMMQDAITILNLKNYKSFFENYNAAGIFYFQNNISEYGTDYVFLHKFVVFRNDPELCTEAIDYLIFKHQLNESLTLLEFLKNKQITNDLIIKLQENIGKELAQRDFNNNPHSNPTENILSYTNADKWYKYFKNSYLKNWKTKN